MPRFAKISYFSHLFTVNRLHRPPVLYANVKLR